jgi:hypothetical protein
MNTDGQKIVHFDEYCKTCVNKDCAEKDEPCYSCLEEPVNQNSHKPVKYEKK